MQRSSKPDQLQEYQKKHQMILSQLFNQDLEKLIIEAISIKKKLDDRLSKQQFFDSFNSPEYIVDEIAELAKLSITLLEKADTLHYLPRSAIKHLQLCIVLIQDITNNQYLLSQSCYEDFVTPALKSIALFVNCIKFIAFINKSYPQLLEHVFEEKFCFNRFIEMAEEKKYNKKTWSALTSHEVGKIKNRILMHILNKIVELESYKDNVSQIFLDLLQEGRIVSLLTEETVQPTRVPYVCFAKIISLFYTQDLDEQLKFKKISPLYHLIDEVLLDLYCEAIKDENGCPYYYCLLSPEQIRESIARQNHENKGRVTFYWQQFYLHKHPLSEEQCLALQESMRGVNSITLLNNEWAFHPSNAQWKFIGSLTKNVNGLSIPYVRSNLTESPAIGLTSATLKSFKLAIQTIKSLDISGIFLAKESETEENYNILAEAIKPCEHLHLGGSLTFALRNKELYISFLHKVSSISLSLAQLCIGYGYSSYISSLPVFYVRSLSLSNTGLEDISIHDWELLCSKLTYVHNLDLNENDLYRWLENSDAYIKALSQLKLKRINLDNCGLDVCSDEKWANFCKALSDHKINCVFAPISGLSEERRSQLDAILQVNACRTSLMAATIHLIWNNPIILNTARQSAILCLELKEQFEDDSKHIIKSTRL